MSALGFIIVPALSTQGSYTYTSLSVSSSFTTTTTSTTDSNCWAERLFLRVTSGDPHCVWPLSGGLAQFIMPTNGTDCNNVCFVESLLAPVDFNLSSYANLTATVEVDTLSGSPQFGGWAANPNVRLYFQDASPYSFLCPSKVYAGNFWFAKPLARSEAGAGSYFFTAGGSNGRVTLTVKLIPADWVDACGTRGSAEPAAFYWALSHAASAGLFFGSGWNWDTGVFTSNGTALFRLWAFK